ncbi:DUF1795 domain-containing protein, partial [Rahnella woolbedingensis]
MSFLIVAGRFARRQSSNISADPKGRTFEEELDYQWSLLIDNVELIRSESRQVRHLSRSPGYVALETECDFKRGAHVQYQRQLAIHLPERHQMLIFTSTALAPFSA